jgi:hypothetical protein
MALVIVLETFLMNVEFVEVMALLMEHVIVLAMFLMNVVFVEEAE